jgi:hypothetical protein
MMNPAKLKIYMIMKRTWFLDTLRGGDYKLPTVADMIEKENKSKIYNSKNRSNKEVRI